MKLIIYDTLNTQPQRDGKRSVHIDSMSGVISFSKYGCEMCKLEEGDKIVIASSVENPKEWLFAKTNIETGFVLKRYKNVLKISNRVVANKLISSLKLARTATFLISKTPQIIDGIEYYPLITSKPVSQTPRNYVRKKFKDQ